ncbi:MAG: RHS repeat-associated core domain-containing protein [Verrucomicrobiales bacterium]|nr:RHS repeat-associated core domain-containing protein [Verrucomicrobiales bacterium]
MAQIDAAGQVVQRHLWGTDLSGSMQGAGGVGGLLGTWDNGATTRDGSEPSDGVARGWVCAYDGNGNVSAAIAATVAGGGASGNGGGAGTVRVARYDYDAFGKTLATWGDGAVAEANRYRFSTKPEDGTGLLYYGYRYLDTRMGRWVSRDPIGERGGVNVLTLPSNNITINIDRLGLEVVCGITATFDYSQDMGVLRDLPWFTPIPGHDYSGHIFVGQLTLHGANGTDIASYPIVTGGYRSENNRVQPNDDTGAPSGNFEVGTTPSGGNVAGFPVYGTADLGRTAIEIHGGNQSAGCLTFPGGGSWDEFSDHMLDTHSAGVRRVPITIAYVGVYPIGNRSLDPDGGDETPSRQPDFPCPACPSANQTAN